MLAAAALRVDGGRGDFLGAAVAEPCGAGDVHRLGADLVDATADHLADVARLDAGAVDDFHHHGTEHVGGMGAGEASVALANGRAASFDDDDVSHEDSCDWTTSSA